MEGISDRTLKQLLFGASGLQEGKSFLGLETKINNNQSPVSQTENFIHATDSLLKLVPSNMTDLPGESEQFTTSSVIVAAFHFAVVEAGET